MVKCSYLPISYFMQEKTYQVREDQTLSGREQLQSALYLDEEMDFFLDVSAIAHERGSWPSVDVIFSQNQANSWVDLVFQSSFTEVSTEFNVETVPTIKLPSNTLKFIDVLGSQEDQMVVVRWAYNHTPHDVQHRLHVNFITSFQSHRLGQHVKISVPTVPLSLIWKSDILLSADTPDHMIMLPGKPEELNVRNMIAESIPIQVVWLPDTDIEQRISCVEKDPYHCKLDIPCSASKFTSTCSFHCADSKHRCVISNDFYGYPHRHKFESCKANNQSRNHHVYSFLDSKDTHLCTHIFYCVNITCLLKGQTQNFVLFHPYNFARSVQYCSLWAPSAKHFCWFPPSRKVSWIAASKLCRTVQGHLPVFKNRQQIEEFVRILKFGVGIPPIQVVYLGMIYNYKVDTGAFRIQLKLGLVLLLAYTPVFSL